MSQIPNRPTPEDDATRKIVAITSKRPVIEFGDFETPGRRAPSQCEAVKAAIAMLRFGKPSARITYGTERESKSAAASLCHYRKRNGLPVIVEQRLCVVIVRPAKEVKR